MSRRWRHQRRSENIEDRRTPTRAGSGTSTLSEADGPQPILEVDHLVVEFGTERGVVHAVNGVSFDVRPGETLAIVGESGSGKSVTIQTIMGAVPMPPGRIAAGTVRYRGQDLFRMSPAERRALRGSRISMITHDALTALNPTFTVGFQIAEMYQVHRGMSRRDARRRAVDMLERVHIPDAANRVNEYPHQFSGGCSSV